MDQIVVPVLFAVLIEATVYFVDQLAVNRNLDWRMIAALLVSILACVAFSVDVFAEGGFVSVIPFVGSVFTGIIFARMANFANSVFEATHNKAKS